MSEVENKDVTGTDHVVQAPGNNIISFDELESVTSAKENAEKAIENAEKAKTSALAKELKKGLEKDEEKERKLKEDEEVEDFTADDELEDDTEKEKPEEEEVEEEGDLAARKKEEEELVEKANEKVKVYKVKSGDDNVLVRADTAFKVKVNGKLETVPLSDLMANYSGKTNWDRKYSELDKERKSFEGNRNVLLGSLDTLNKLVAEDPKEAVTYLAELVGADPLKVWHNLRDQTSQRLEEFVSLTPEERKAKDTEEELNWFKQREQKLSQTRAKEKVEKEMLARVSAVEEKLGIDRETFSQLYQELVKKGDRDLGDITPEFVGEFYKEKKAGDSIKSMLKQYAPDLSQDEINSAITTLKPQMDNLTVEDLREVILEVYGNKAAKNLSRKLKKSKPVNTAKPTRKNEPLFFEDLTA